MIRPSVILILSCVTALAQGKYTEKMYRAGLAGGSTSQLYVLFTLHDNKTGADRVVCTLGDFLEGAIHTEFHIDYDQAGLLKAHQIAVSQPARRFAFKNRKAIHNVRPNYTPEVLAKVRQAFASQSNKQLIARTEDFHYTLEDGFPNRTLDDKIAYQYAIAHVMLERGILVGNADRTGLIYVER